ncbi:MAG TPA: DotU family type IV/VI secretion system protein [Pseudomonadota bacterium]|jgi:type VI secretion system protein ImpK|nr:DotU family type IV/VI secretion system protein [Pseudomonadota bacterium]HND09463.1 DotU family type IV/VI secretion system protein [Pseudomonadota bacterium]HNF96417.1 DotU family type IV/VI secretion system protein [Pseudomonadota bacterium]HNK43838.1 DotU family type IV/VI secretion system protein [Pseudomonadota bacterium]HNN49678.1 DotU family type IV/VI secretion system protein [Pseudomonadota bacterium]
MATETSEQLFLVDYFREFYAAVLQHRMQIEKASAPAVEEDSLEIREADILDEERVPGEEPSQIAPDMVQARLVELLDTQQQAVQRRGDPREQKRFSEIQYVMAAMADEVFLSIEWIGKEYWSTHLLEERFFNTHDAGTRFFDNLDSLLQNRDATRADVLAVYLLAVSLGFRGKHRSVSSAPQIAHYRNQAYVTLFQRSPALPESTPLFPQAYAHTLDGQPPSWLPQLRPWLLSLVGVAVMYLLVAHVIWDRRSTSVSNRLEEILQRKDDSAASGSRKVDSRSELPAQPDAPKTELRIPGSDVKTAAVTNEGTRGRSGTSAP